MTTFAILSIISPRKGTRADSRTGAEKIQDELRTYCCAAK